MNAVKLFHASPFLMRKKQHETDEGKDLLTDSSNISNIFPINHFLFIKLQMEVFTDSCPKTFSTF